MELKLLFSEDFPIWWKNFIYRDTIDGVHCELALYNATYRCNSDAREEIITFETEEDMITFLLKWS